MLVVSIIYIIFAAKPNIKKIFTAFLIVYLQSIHLAILGFSICNDIAICVFDQIIGRTG